MRLAPWVALRGFYSTATGNVQAHHVFEHDPTGWQHLEATGAIQRYRLNGYRLFEADTVPAWWPDWSGRTVVIVAGGPSAAIVGDRRFSSQTMVLAVNESWRLVPNADALYACDGGWWNKVGGVPQFSGLRMTQDATAAQVHGLHRFRLAKNNGGENIRASVPGEICNAGNGGMQAINIAVQFGATRLLLAGFDMTLSRGCHWHGPHTGGLRNPAQNIVDGWRKKLDGAAPALAALGVQVQVIGDSALRAFPFVNIDEVSR